MQVELKTTDKLPNWFKWILFILLAALAVVLLYGYFNAMDNATQRGLAKKKIEKSIDSLSTKMSNDSKNRISTAHQTLETAEKLTEKVLQHEKAIIPDPGTDSLDRFITEYSYAE